ncbi:prolipoprotein diacylglyceryl transferase [Rubrivirga marina]|uniref:Phosphatidylglycerol--prolipoprotein diacylglyceryl transferase n=1 Tax=Rubrivirga marina TaxID=1196024 RepID=A0A271J0L4_9BACT|nr:prolipoprotein diacylglyceryl transferase family protein [Rubrivirga marina]PAP76900.1 diacylglyceryl transferase [Rubrivirga marina]
MYPRISDLTRDLFGFELPVPLYSFGLMVAVAILVATAMTRIEVDRRYALGWMSAVRAKVKDAKGREKVALTSPSALLWNMALMAGFFGVVGAKLFHIIDYWDEFTADPLGMIFSGSGLTVYGGILLGSVVILWYAKKKGVSRAHLADAAAPGLLFAYGIGRIGCYLSGDGDWGVCSQLEDKPGWIPSWLWSETFPRNMLGQMDPVVYNATQRGAECTLASPDGVYPTMLYEFAMAAVLAGVLWMLRKNPFQAGWLISLYLVFAGLERFLIEFIRVNPEAAFGMPQSQLISIGFVLAGLVGLALTTRRRTDDTTPDAEPAAATATA